jgi:hypothetical protein
MFSSKSRRASTVSLASDGAGEIAIGDCDAHAARNTVGKKRKRRVVIDEV